MPRPIVLLSVMVLAAACQTGKASGHDSLPQCISETDSALCARLGKNCGGVSATDVCDLARTVESCGTCTGADTCGGGGTANVCGHGASCQAEDDASFCSRLGMSCGSASGTDNCGIPRAVSSCGTCPGTDGCGDGGADGKCDCAAETDSAFCARLGKTCGSVSGADNCGAARTVSSCGVCVGHDVCGGGGIDGVCGCAAETGSAFCARLGKNCGLVDGTDNCGKSRSVASCGTCSGSDTCGGNGSPGVCGTTGCQVYETLGGGGFPNLCGECTPEDDVAFCVRQGKTCGSVTAADSCFVTRTVDCGTCATGTCGGGGNPNVCGASSGCVVESDAALCARFGKACGHVTATDNCGQGRKAVVCGSACECSDGVDNDGDGFVDWPDDLGCSGPDDTEVAVTGQIKNGWTAFKKSSDTSVFYVSGTDGSDSYDGTSPTHTSGNQGPKKTIAAGVALLRNNHADWLLLKRGDVFTDQELSVSKSGSSSSAPLLISSYGPVAGNETDRPLLTYKSLTAGKYSSISIGKVQHVAIAHIAATLPVPNQDTPGLDIEGANDVLVEGCRFDGGNGGIIVDGAESNTSGDLRLRRNVVYEPDGHGFFVYGTTTLLSEENIIYHPRTVTTSDGDRHGMYLARGGNSNLTVRGNLVYMSLSENLGDGIMMRPGGVAEGNVVVGAGWTGVHMGECCDGGSPVGTNGPVVMDGNLVLDTPGANAGLGYDPQYTLPGAQAINNIVMRTWVQGSYIGLSIEAGGDSSVLANNTFVDAPADFTAGSGISWQNNVMFGSRGGIPLVFTDQLAKSKNFQARNNLFYPWATGDSTVSFSEWKSSTGETGSSSAFSLVNASCSLATYNDTLGGAKDTPTFFQTAATHHGKFDYDPNYASASAVNYIRACVAVAP